MGRMPGSRYNGHQLPAAARGGIPLSQPPQAQQIQLVQLPFMRTEIKLPMMPPLLMAPFLASLQRAIEGDPADMAAMTVCGIQVKDINDRMLWPVPLEQPGDLTNAAVSAAETVGSDATVEIQERPQTDSFAEEMKEKSPILLPETTNG